jgi:nucleoid DNA-binding protein
MTTDAKVIEDAIICNEINQKAIDYANNGIPINRDIMLCNYTKQTIDDCWESLIMNVIQNYHKGKGTFIKGLGTFTFKRQVLNMKGTTNEYERDKGEDEPVFIVSKELNNKCMPGEYTRTNNIIYFTQKESKNIPISKISYSEIAYRLSMSKDEVENILKNLIKSISESIEQGKFKNKILPGLGILFCKYNIMAVKFFPELIERIKEKNQKLIRTKKRIYMDMDIDNFRKTFYSKKFNRTLCSLQELKSSQGLNTRLDTGGQEYLEDKYHIDITEIPQHEIRDIYNSVENNKGKLDFINDYDGKKNKLKNENNEEEKKSPLFNLDEETLKNFLYYKGILILNSRKFDKNKLGFILKEDAINSILHSEISNKIDYDIAKSIVEYYSETDNVDYMQFIAQIIKDINNFFVKRR